MRNHFNKKFKVNTKSVFGENSKVLRFTIFFYLFRLRAFAYFWKDNIMVLWFIQFICNDVLYIVTRQCIIKLIILLFNSVLVTPPFDQSKDIFTDCDMSWLAKVRGIVKTSSFRHVCSFDVFCLQSYWSR